MSDIPICTHEIPTCTYEESYEEDTITLTIRGLYSTDSMTDLIAMIWSAVRKKGIAEFKVDAYLDVSIDDFHGIVCVFHPNLAVGERYNIENYKQHFERIFPCLIVDFTEVVDTFSTDSAFRKCRKISRFCKDEATRASMTKDTMEEFLRRMNLKK